MRARVLVLLLSLLAAHVHAANTTWFDVVYPNLYDTTFNRTQGALRLYGAYGFDDPADPLYDDTNAGNVLNITGNYAHRNDSFAGGYLAMESDARITLPVPSVPIPVGDVYSFTVLVRVPESRMDEIFDAALANYTAGVPFVTVLSPAWRDLSIPLRFPFRGGISIDIAIKDTLVGIEDPDARFTGVIHLPFVDDAVGKFVPLVFTFRSVDNTTTRLVVGTTTYARTYAQLTGYEWNYQTIYKTAYGIGINSLLADGVTIGGAPFHLSMLMIMNDAWLRTPILFNTHFQQVPVAYPPTRTTPVAYFDFEDGSMDNRVEGYHVGHFRQNIMRESGRYFYATRYYGTYASLPEMRANLTVLNYVNNTSPTTSSCFGNPNGACHRGDFNSLWTTSGGVRYNDFTLCYRTYIPSTAVGNQTNVYHGPSIATHVAECNNSKSPASFFSSALHGYFLSPQGLPNMTILRTSIVDEETLITAGTVPLNTWLHMCAVHRSLPDPSTGKPVVTYYASGPGVNWTSALTPFDYTNGHTFNYCCNWGGGPSTPSYRIGPTNDRSPTDVSSGYTDKPYSEMANIALPTTPHSYTDDVALYAYALNASEVYYLQSIATTPAPTQSPGYIAPSAPPTDAPTGVLTDAPGATPYPTLAPTRIPSPGPTPEPTAAPSAAPSAAPTGPSAVPTPAPSSPPTAAPSAQPSGAPSRAPSATPTLATPAPTFIPSAAPTPFAATAPLNSTLEVPSATWVQSLVRIVAASDGTDAASVASVALAFVARANGSFLSRAFSPRTPGALTESGCSLDLPGTPVLGFHVWPADAYRAFPSPLYIAADPSGLPFDASAARVIQCVQQTWELRDPAALPAGVVSLAPGAPIVTALSVPGISALVLLGDRQTSCAAGRHGCTCARTSASVAPDLPLYTALLVVGLTLALAAGLASILTAEQTGRALSCLDKTWPRGQRAALRASIPTAAVACLAAALAVFPRSEYGPSAALVQTVREPGGGVARTGADGFLGTAYAVASLCAAGIALVRLRWTTTDRFNPLAQAAVRVLAGAALAIPSTALAPADLVTVAPLVLAAGGGLGALVVAALGARLWPKHRDTVVACWLALADLSAYASVLATWLKWPCLQSYYGDTRV